MTAAIGFTANVLSSVTIEISGRTPPYNVHKTPNHINKLSMHHTLTAREFGYAMKILDKTGH